MSVTIQFGDKHVQVGVISNSGGLGMFVRLVEGKNSSEKRMSLARFLEETGLSTFVGIKPKPEEAAPTAGG